MIEAKNIEQKTTDAATTPTWAEILRQLKEACKYEMRVCMPAIIQTYNKNKQTVDVQPVYQTQYIDGTVEDPPVIYNVPVCFMRSGNAFVSMPLKKGDKCLLVFSDRSLEKWKASGAIHAHDDVRAHHITDAFAFPCGYPPTQALNIANADDIIISNVHDVGGIEMRIKPNGHVQILNKGQELVKVLWDIVEVLREAVTYTCGGPEHLRHTQFQNVHDRLRTFLES